jgi:hypothetical protein
MRHETPVQGKSQAKLKLLWLKVDNLSKVFKLIKGTAACGGSY